jgi:hypothetical protein
VQSALGPQTVDFSADNQLRKLSTSGPDGSINLTVNTADTMIIGDAEQQQSALSSYLQQFQREQARGDGNPTLMSMFESAFTAMNSNYNVVRPERGSAIPAAGESLMTGLADFTASVVQTPISSNPYRPTEVDAFSYQVSQVTDVENADPQNLAIAQQQNSHLSASFHTAVSGTGPLYLTANADSQNYDYVQVNDSSSNEAQIGYQQGVFVEATVSHSASQSTRKREYEHGLLTQDTTTPTEQSWSKNFLPQLSGATSKPAQGRSTTVGASDGTSSPPSGSQTGTQATPGTSSESTGASGASSNGGSGSGAAREQALEQGVKELQQMLARLEAQIAAAARQGPGGSSNPALGALQAEASMIQSQISAATAKITDLLKSSGDTQNK